MPFTHVGTGDMFLNLFSFCSSTRFKFFHDTFKVSVHNKWCFHLIFYLREFENGIFWKFCFLFTKRKTFLLVLISMLFRILQPSTFVHDSFSFKAMQTKTKIRQFMTVFGILLTDKSRKVFL